MKLRFLLVSAFVSISSAYAVDLPAVPQDSIAVKQELLFAEDFEGKVPHKAWHRVVPTFAVESGTLKGTQTRDVTIPAKDGKPEIKAHAAVHGLEIATSNSIVEAKIRFEGASMIDIEFDDRAYKGAHYGHLCRAQFRLNGVTIIDECEGNMRNDIREMRNDPSKKAEVAKLLIGRQVTYPVKLEPNRWYDVVVETVGDSMRVTVDRTPVAFLKSPGIAHSPKSKIELGVAGKDGYFDDVKVWSAEPTQQ
jgi:hypothetical protein